MNPSDCLTTRLAISSSRNRSSRRLISVARQVPYGEAVAHRIPQRGYIPQPRSKTRRGEGSPRLPRGTYLGNRPTQTAVLGKGSTSVGHQLSTFSPPTQA